MKIRSLSLIMALALSGCSLMPEYQQPAPPVASAWPQGEAYAGATTQDGARLPLREEFFRHPSLRQLIDLALENNRDLRQAALNVEAYRALYRIQRSERLPSLGVDGSGNRQRLPDDLSPTGEAGISSQYGVTLGVSAWELDLFGRVRSLESAALERYLATEQAQHAVQLALVSDVAGAWLGWNTNHALLELTRSTLESHQESLRMIEASHTGGIASALDVRQARSLVEQARVQLALYTRQRAQDHNALQLLVGTRIAPELLATELDSPLLAELAAGLPAEVLQQRPDIRAAEFQLRAANADIGAARAAFFPSIRLTAAAGTASADLDGLFDGGSGSWSFMPQIHLPIFTAGRLRANLEYSELQRDIHVARYEQSIQNAFREVSDGLAARSTYRQQLRAQDDLVRATHEYYELAQQRYDGGVDNYLVVLDAQRELFAARQQRLTYRLQSLNNEVALYRALGGGWQSSTAADPEE